MTELYVYGTKPATPPKFSTGAQSALCLIRWKALPPLCQDAVMRRELGIRKGEIWAYRQGANEPLVPVRITDPGTHYDARIDIESIAGSPYMRTSVKRVKLPCKWEHVEEYKARYNAIQARKDAQKALSTRHVPPYEPVKEQEILILVTLDNKVTQPIAYNVQSAGAAVGYSAGTIYKALQNGELTARYANSKAIITHEELHAWVKSLPLEWR